MTVWIIAWKSIKSVYRNPALALLILGIPLFLVGLMNAIFTKAGVGITPEQTAGFVEMVILGGKGSVSLLNQVVASTFVMSIMVDAIAVVGTFATEREQNTLMRTLTTPVPKSSVIIGNLLGQLLTMFALAAVVLGITHFAMGIRWSAAWGQLLTVTGVVIFTATAFGLLLSVFFRNPKVAAGVGAIVVNVMAFLSGGFSTDGTFSNTANFTINKWAFDAYAKMMAGGSWTDLLPNLLLLGCIGIILLGIASIVLRRENIYE